MVRTFQPESIADPASQSIWGCLGFVFDTSSSVALQVPHAIPSPLTASSQILALQLGNAYGLLGLMGFGILYQTNEAKVVRNYLVTLAIGDIGHLWATYIGMGHAKFVDIGNWNKLAWGNIGFTFFLFVTRVGYLSGLFGKDRIVASVKKSR